MKKTILITGASSGIGKATAELFIKNGWNVAATMRNPENNKDLIESEHLKIFKLDVCDTDSINKAFSEAIQYFGNIDALLNNAGYGAIGVFEKATNEQIRKEFDVNVFGLMNATKAILPYFKSKKNGIIINVASVAGHVGFPLFSVYNASKFAVEGFTEALSYELKQFNIRLKLIEPGAIKTDFYTRSPDLFINDDLKEYASYEKKSIGYYMKAGDNAPPPEIVAQTIYKAANDNSKKLRYSIGGNAPLLIFLKRFLPNKLVKSIIEIGMNLR